MDIRLIRDAIGQVVGGQPHPDAPDMSVNDYPSFERVAAMLNSQILRGNKPKPEMVTHAFHTLKGAEMSPMEFEDVWTTARPVANRLLGRDPSIADMMKLKGSHPGDVQTFYANHPYPGYEEVKAGDVAKYMRAAEPIARKYGRTPNVEEATRFAAANYESEDIHAHYGGSW